ncbi:hypothetical protein O9G_000796 [Rozella allomycis CSF55]|uniref:Hyaluronan/mRNA-binding protein domain-containing protein n=1 Tax=Rozella allomycis (strain CSF55) TaxID=988480 RepID=A0A075AR03_ROZAC|nr:hypothetical protein O9G_000796 [Rozella allomycis CSF55]|eukprot:EPZ32721.1 hypothetical protein O9G_000796 [Rozella allomycis CSF55]
MVKPSQVTKDRHLSRDGASHSEKKHGAGRHNWGTYEDELDEVGVTAGEVYDDKTVNSIVEPNSPIEKKK